MTPRHPRADSVGDTRDRSERQTEKNPSDALVCDEQSPACDHAGVKVLLRNPRREIDIEGPITIVNLLRDLGLQREEVLVIRGGELVPGDESLSNDDFVEIRPVISGGFQ